MSGKLYEPAGLRYATVTPMAKLEEVLHATLCEVERQFWKGVASDQCNAFDQLVSNLDQALKPVKLMMGNRSVIVTRWPLP